MLEPSRIAELLEPFSSGVPEALTARLGVYLDLLARWNARTNLTSVRDSEEIVRRHFGESLFAARILWESLGQGGSVLDFGSGAGFPGVPMALAQPSWQVVLAESQGKKASFLREVKRTLRLENVQVWADRADQIPAETMFSAVALRAVDDPVRAFQDAKRLVAPGGWLVHLHGRTPEAGWQSVPLPESHGRWVSLQKQ